MACCNDRVALPLVFTSSAAKIAFDTVGGIWFVSEGVMSVRQRLRARGGSNSDPSVGIVAGCVAAAAVLSQILGRRGGLIWPGGTLWPLVAGLVLLVCGLVLRAWSIITLGRFFQYQIRIQTGHRVITSGPYRFVRHPSYTGVILGIAGYSLASGDVYSLLVSLVLTAIGLTVRIRVEEKQLHDALGADYDEFAAHHKRLIPGVF